MMGRFGISLCLLLLCFSWCHSQPVNSAADTFRELVELLRSLHLADSQEGYDTEPMGSPEMLSPDAGTLEKRDLPRLGVQRFLPSRVYSSKSLDASRDHFLTPSKWMSSHRG